VSLVNDDVQIATVSLSTAVVTVLLRANTLRVTGRLGSMAVHDDSDMEVAAPQFKEIMSIEGDNFAEFTYQTLDPNDPDNAAHINSLVVFKAASIKLHFIEQALRAVYLFLMKLSNLKFLYDAAAQAAVQRASEITRMQFEVSIRSPILIFPTDATTSVDVLNMRLGEITARNDYKGDVTKTSASLHGIQLASILGQQRTLKMIDDIDIDTELTQTANIDRNCDRNFPDTQVCGLVPVSPRFSDPGSRSRSKSQMSGCILRRHNTKCSCLCHSPSLESLRPRQKR
jgi:vacuolar protein sorting-associated protein 13A/C